MTLMFPIPMLIVIGIIIYFGRKAYLNMFKSSEVIIKQVENKRTQKELAMLIAKFERDVAKRTRWFRFLLALDQMINVVFWNGSQDETVSSHLGRRIKDGTATWFDKLVCNFLRFIEFGHCKESAGE